MTPEHNKRIHELPFLIDKEKDPDKLKALAAELETLLAVQLREFSSRGPLNGRRGDYSPEAS